MFLIVISKRGSWQKKKNQLFKTHHFDSRTEEPMASGLRVVVVVVLVEGETFHTLFVC